MADRRSLRKRATEAASSVAGTLGEGAREVASTTREGVRRVKEDVQERQRQRQQVTDQTQARLQRAEERARQEALRDAQEEFREEYSENVRDSVQEQEIERLRREYGMREEEAEREQRMGTGASLPGFGPPPATEDDGNGGRRPAAPWMGPAPQDLDGDGERGEPEVPLEFEFPGV